MKNTLQIASQCWCDPRTKNKEMDIELAVVFAEKLKPFVELASAVEKYIDEINDMRPSNKNYLEMVKKFEQLEAE